jgi:hypothetical protein
LVIILPEAFSHIRTPGTPQPRGQATTSKKKIIILWAEEQNLPPLREPYYDSTLAVQEISQPAHNA